jgi:hypothetical protein
MSYCYQCDEEEMFRGYFFALPNPINGFLTTHIILQELKVYQA